MDEHNKDIQETEDAHLALAHQFGMEVYTDLIDKKLSKDFYRTVPYSFVKRHLALPIEERGGVLIVAISDPAHLDPLEELRLMLGRVIKAVYVPKDILVVHIQECYHREKGAASAMIADMRERGLRDEAHGVEVYDLLEENKDQTPVVKLLNLILTEAVQQCASDVHFEPNDEGMRVRYRIDGVLQNRHLPPAEHQNQLITRIKVMAKMDIAERRRPQDGRIKLRMGNREIDFRVSTVPVVNGERIVLRILDKGTVILGLDQLGMYEDTFEKFKHHITLPEGIVLVTGPTGSGKTTTLYSAISEMPDENVNIMTVEDPVEIKLKGIAQIGVYPKIGLNFAEGLRHILRQDPDVIMIGEIRDVETAEIAIQSSLTGHLVLSTLHTNDAPSAVTRLVDMGIEPYLLASTMVSVLAQRLVRKICPECREEYKPSDRELHQLGIDKKEFSEGKLYRGKGCSACFETGYRGRHGLYELMTVTPAVQKQIVISPDSVALRSLAISEGMVSLRDHGAELVKEGITTVAEVLRVTRGIEGEG